MEQSNWIVCIARNNVHLTKRALETFLAQDIGNVCVLLIDNASTDGTAEWMNTLRRPIATISFSQQRSVAACWNVALTWFFLEGADGWTPSYSKYVLVANNDVELRPETYRMLRDDGGPFVTAVGVNSREQMMEPLEPENKRPHPDFSCYLIRRETFECTGGFDERYEIAFAEDADMHVRLHRLGIPAYCIGVPFYHVGSATIKHADTEEQLRIAQQADKNRELFYGTYGERIGTPGYDNLFTPGTFGSDSR